MAANPNGGSAGLTRPDGTIPLRVDGKPRFCVFVDTEEEFDWAAPFRREAEVRTLAALPEMQARFASRGVQPIYLVTYPVVDTGDGAATIRDLAANDAATVGAQLHGWVTPPFDEPLSRHNSFAGNLSPELEAEKLRRLTRRITEATGRPPTIYRAGRYGVGPSTAATLLDLGYRLDVSVRPGFDYSAEGGPDFRDFDPQPFRTGRDGALLALPLGVADTGWAPSLVARVPAPLRSPLTRLRASHRVPLTPEGTTPAEASRAIDRLLGAGLRLLSLSFHSPSLVPGCTPYVRDAADLGRFHRWWDVVLGHLARRGVEPIGGDALMALLDRAERLPARGRLR